MPNWMAFVLFVGGLIVTVLIVIALVEEDGEE